MKLPTNTEYSLARLDKLKDMAEHHCSLHHISAALEIPEREVIRLAKELNTHIWIGTR